MGEQFGGAAALDVVADETRQEILQVLADRQAEDPTDRSMRFADLRKAVGVRDSGNFSYHLQKLTGWLVEESEQGYHLSPRGMRVMSTLAGGAYDEESTFGPAELDRACPVCGADMTATHEEGAFHIACENDHAISDFLSVNVVEDQPIEAVLELVARHGRWYIESVLAGFCAFCDGPVAQAAYEFGEEEFDDGFHFACERCGTPYAIPPAGVAVVDPAVSWFAYERGEDIWADPWTLFELLMDPEYEQVASDPVRFDVWFDIGGDRLRVTVDDEPSVVDTEPTPEARP